MKGIKLFVKMRIRFIGFIFLTLFFFGCSPANDDISTFATQETTRTSEPTQIIAPTVKVSPTPTPIGGITEGMVAYQIQYEGDVFLSPLSSDKSFNATEGIKGYKEIIGLSPDGKWLAVSVSKNNNDDPFNEQAIWIINVLSGEQSYLINTDPKAIFWSPMDNSVYFTDYADDNSDTKIYKYDLLHRELNPIKDHSMLNAYSPKAGLFYFEFSETEGNFDGSGWDYLEKNGNKIILTTFDIFCYDYMNLGKVVVFDSECFYSVDYCFSNEETSINRTCVENEGLVEIKKIKTLDVYLANDFVSISPNRKSAVASNLDDEGFYSFQVIAMEGDHSYDIGKSMEYSTGIFYSTFLPNVPIWSTDGNNLLLAEKTEGDQKQVLNMYDISTGDYMDTQLLNWLFNNYEVWDWDYVSPISNQ